MIHGATMLSDYKQFVKWFQQLSIIVAHHLLSFISVIISCLPYSTQAARPFHQKHTIYLVVLIHASLTAIRFPTDKYRQ